MTDQNTGDENLTRHLAPLTMYQLNSDAERDGNAQMCMCDLLNVYLSVTRADALERSHCLQLGLRVRVNGLRLRSKPGKVHVLQTPGASDLFSESTASRKRSE